MVSTNPLLAPLPTTSGPSSRPFFAPSANEHTFHAHSAIGIASKVTLQSAGVGLLVSAVQNALERYVCAVFAACPHGMSGREHIQEMREQKRLLDMGGIATSLVRRWGRESTSAGGRIKVDASGEERDSKDGGSTLFPTYGVADWTVTIRALWVS